MEYNEIAEDYVDSKQLPFRKHVEEYSLFEMLGNIDGKSVVDLACGNGFYTRKIKMAGASEVTGADISSEMIKLAKSEDTLGCKYIEADVANLELEAPADIIAHFFNAQ